MSLHGLTISGLIEQFRKRELSAEEAVRAAIEAIGRHDQAVHAFLEVFADRSIEQAREIDARRARNEPLGPLAGVPIAIKDNLCLEWGRTTCASRMLEEYRSPFTATCVRKLIDAGAVIVGKTNLDEFAMGSSCERSAFGATRNPWDLSRVPGGSSGGSAAAVAAGMLPGGGALGSDTGGSIRQPAGWCNICGFKPTYGRVSRYGLVAYASSLDQVGPMARTVEDCALLSEVIAGHDPLDSTSVPESLGLSMRPMVELQTPIEDLIVGIPRAANNAPGNHPAVNRALTNAANVLRKLGARVIDIDLAYIEESIAAYYIIAPAEASSNLARFDGVRYGHRASIGPGEDLATLYARSRSEGLGQEVQRRIMLGTHVLSAGYADKYYQTALRARRLIKNAYDSVFAAGSQAAGSATAPACDVILLPSSPGPAFRLGEKSDDPLALYLEDVYTVGVNLAGLPAITVPGGFAEVDGRRLPLGLQFIGPAFQESRLLRAARMFEQATEFWKQQPAAN